ncbi:hypothetical protein M3Y95_00324300 [Aphelenchoides besseyi]|nr:hypothetical protein M3Y95_01145100 [Aphelenchoides besseyi]KAI6230896.1 hypothetical protein M3Y95_00324300 [Aphelenchoides besseyi]
MCSSVHVQVLLFASALVAVNSLYSVNVGGQVQCGKTKANATIYLFEKDGTIFDPDDHCATTYSNKANESKFYMSGYDTETFDKGSDEFYLIIKSNCDGKRDDGCFKYSIPEVYYMKNSQNATFVWLGQLNLNKLSNADCPNIKKEKNSHDEC